MGKLGTGVDEGVTEDDGVTEGVGTEVGVGVRVALGVGEGVGVNAGVGVGIGVDAAAHVGVVMVFESKVTAPFRASTRPLTCAPVVSVTDVKARIFPLKAELVPSVAELPTCQKTLHA